MGGTASLIYVLDGCYHECSYCTRYRSPIQPHQPYESHVPYLKLHTAMLYEEPNNGWIAGLSDWPAQYRRHSPDILSLFRFHGFMGYGLSPLQETIVSPWLILGTRRRRSSIPPPPPSNASYVYGVLVDHRRVEIPLSVEAVAAIPLWRAVWACAMSQLKGAGSCCRTPPEI